MTVTELEIGGFLAAICRATALAATAPVIGDPGVPLRARLIAVLAIGGAVGVNRPGVPIGELPAVAVLELAVGALTGLAARFILARAAVAGQLMGLSLGLGFAAQYDVHAGESASALRSLISAIAGLAFLAGGGLEAIVRSVASPVHVAQLALLGPMLLREGASALTHGLALAAPIVLAALVGNIGMAVMNRAAPAVNVFSVALAVVLVLGGLALLATSGNLVQGLTGDVREAIAILAG
jgi:flagellar biosynthesis protein FliR